MDLERFRKRIQQLFELARGSSGANRPAYSLAEAEAMRLVASWLEEASLQARLDRFGNLWGLPEAEGPFVTSGSHVDTVPDGGRFDGALGTLLAIEATEELRGPFGVLICAAEEAPRFGAGTLGSRSLAGKLSEADLAEMLDAKGVSAHEARAAFLQKLSDIPRLEDRNVLGRLRAHAEVHIEQRRHLANLGAQLGVATVVAGPVRYELRFSGATGHSGELPPQERRDALCAAAEAVLLAERLSKESSSTIVTAGRIEVHPNSLTAVPGEVALGVDLRSTDITERDEVTQRLLRGAEDAASRRGVGLYCKKLSYAEPKIMDRDVVDAVEASCREAGVKFARVPSFAGHDAQHLAELAPTALLFVPSTNGVSHAPEEEVAWKDVESCFEVLIKLLPKLLRYKTG
ncbi:hydantoinase/carbamoylase family amidase [Rubrobacter naiadicus]|uniref:hydantoinase/carbamoylase family amidase n=1 Tax=Rubrobacter naiadicus TaxID=1392641 RepID=UPI00235F5CD2|nr:hydantoinase/carbamoylase family amidase [Rubrobacter naiadicus]